MTGSTDRGHESGVLCSESGDKLAVDKLTFILSRGDEAAEALIVHRLQLLARAEQICQRSLERGFVKLLHWRDDQEMPASADGSRKRSRAEEKEAGEAVAFRPHLEKLFARTGKEVVTEGDVLSFIKAARGGYPKTQKRFFQFLLSEGVLARDREGLVALAALASPAPAGVGFSGSGDAPPEEAGDGEENFPDGKFPIETEPEKDPETEMGIHPQLDSAGVGGGTVEASAAHLVGSQGGSHFERTGEGKPPFSSGRTAFCRPESGAAAVHEGSHFERSGTRSASGSPPDALRNEGGHEASPYGLVEPGDAYRCSDPLAASVEFLSQCPGWQAKRSANQPSSAVALRGKWTQLREDPAIGPEIAETIWRTCLDQAITDRIERQGWKSWVAIFQSRIKRQADVYRPMGAAPAARGRDDR
jgi:hypothetical protein